MPQTGATRYQKFLKSEKAKTKLKSKKDLPKGTNVTKTNFKVKKIVIKEQLKKHGENEILSSRKLNVKELLSRLNHFNTHSRIDALDGIRELITSNPATLVQNLGQFIHNISPLMLNIEKTVRRECLKVLHLILSNAALERIEPFFSIMSTYLRSGMTHIDTRIQEDSLLFLDVLLDCTSRQVAQDFHKIIPNFLDMISKLRVDSKPGRTLTVNLDSQISSVKWRVKVLHRLKDFLQKFIEHNIKDSDEKRDEKINNFTEGIDSYYDLFNPNYTSLCQVACFLAKNQDNALQIDEAQRFKEYVETLMPLLFETWLEVCSTKNTDKNIETVVNEDGAILLRHTLKLISLLWMIIQHLEKKYPNSQIENVFCQKYRQMFSEHFVDPFPFATNIRSKHISSNSPFEERVTDPKLVSDNLELCHLFIKLNPYINITVQSREIAAVLNYIERTFNHSSQNEINDNVIKILHTIFSNDVTSWTKTINVMDALFRKIIWTYFNNNNMPSSFRQQIFTLLCKISLNDRFSHFHNSEAYEKWLNNLPDILLEQSINTQTIDIIHKFAVRKNKTFNIIIKPKLLKIIENLPSLAVTDSSDNYSSYFKLYSVFYWIKNWDLDSLDLLEKLLLDGGFDHCQGKYILDTLRLKSGNMP